MLQNEDNTSYNETYFKLNYFPNDPTKHIDYVLYYQHDKSNKKHDRLNDLRNNFLSKLVQEGFEIYKLKKPQSDSQVCSTYVLLNCSLDRLMEEAERVCLEVSLKEDYLNEIKNEETLINKTTPCKSRCYDRLLKYLKAPRDSQQKKLPSAPFQVEIKYLFEGFEKETNKSEGFISTIRCLLTDSILQNLNFENDTSITAQFIKKITLKEPTELNDDNPLKLFTEAYKKSKSADQVSRQKQNNHFYNLPYMLEKGVFNDAFILHKSVDSYSNDYVTFDRPHLNESWASFSNVFKFQPLYEVRNYFGEYVAFYFAWLGVLLATLWIPTIIGVGFFIAGIVMSIVDSANSGSTLPNNSSSIYGDYYLNIFADSFDNVLTPCFAVVICLWGAVASEYWKQQNSELAYKWDTENYEKRENNRPEYDMKLEELKLKEYPNYRRYLKYIVSFTILVFMIGIVAIDIAAIVIFRIYIKTKVFPTNEVASVLLGDGGSTIINTILIVALNRLYDIIAFKLTEWENPRTQTDFEDALILKLFAFQFVNSYGSLFYLAFFRNIEYPNGLFGLGSDYQDKCDNQNCMALLTIQVLVVLLIKPFPRLLTTVILPLIKKIVRKIRCNFQKEGLELIKPKSSSKWYDFISNEHAKPDFEGNIRDEYMEKIILYGYIMLFACSFTLGPLIFLIIILIDLRVDAKRLLWIFRRPVGKKAEDIGLFFGIFQFINIIGIVSNGFIIAYTSSWSVDYFGSNENDRLKFVIAFEHIIFFIWILIVVITPSIPSSVLLKMKEEYIQAKELIIAARHISENTQDKTFLKRYTQTFNGLTNLLLKRENTESVGSSIVNEQQAKQRKQMSKKMMSIENKIHPNETSE